MKVSRTEWETLHSMIARFGETEEELKFWKSPTFALIWKKKTMLEQLDYFINELEELEREMEIPE